MVLHAEIEAERHRGIVDGLPWIETAEVTTVPCITCGTMREVSRMPSITSPQCGRSSMYCSCRIFSTLLRDRFKNRRVLTVWRL